MKKLLFLLLLTINAFADPTNPDILTKSYNKYLFEASRGEKQILHRAYEIITKEEGYSQKEYQDTTKKAICHGLNFTDIRYKNKTFTQEECKVLTLGYVYNDYVFLKKKLNSIQELNVVKIKNKKTLIIHSKRKKLDILTLEQKANFLSFAYNVGITSALKKEHIEDLIILTENKTLLHRALKTKCKISSRELKFLKKALGKNLDNFKTDIKICDNELVFMYNAFKQRHLSFSKNSNREYLSGLVKRREKEFTGFGLAL